MGIVPCKDHDHGGEEQVQDPRLDIDNGIVHNSIDKGAEHTGQDHSNMIPVGRMLESPQSTPEDDDGCPKEQTYSCQPPFYPGIQEGVVGMGLDQVILDGIVFIREDTAADQGIGTDGIPGDTPYFSPSVHVGIQNLVAGNKAQKLGINNNSDKKYTAKDKQKQGLLESPAKKEKKQDGNGQGKKNSPAFG